MGRTKDPKALAGPGARLLEQLREAGSFYAADYGSNDDWYWMYAAVRAGKISGLSSANLLFQD